MRAAIVFLSLSLALANAIGCASEPSAAPARVDHACARCGREIHGSAVDWQGALYHPACYEAVGPRCGICGKLLMGRVARSGSGGPSYHEACWRSVPRCDACGAAIVSSRPPARWEDGRLSCTRCRETAIVRDDDAAGVLALARADLARSLAIDTSDAPVPVRLVGKPELCRRAGAELADPNLKAFTQVVETWHGDRLDARTFEVNVLYGLPRDALYGVFAHELFHVAQACAGAPRSMDAALREGSANWVQWRLLAARGDVERAKLLLQDDDPTYGGGLRRFAKLVDARGVRDALDVGLRGERFPDGF